MITDAQLTWLFRHRLSNSNGFACCRRLPIYHDRGHTTCAGIARIEEAKKAMPLFEVTAKPLVPEVITNDKT